MSARTAWILLLLLAGCGAPEPRPDAASASGAPGAAEVASTPDPAAGMPLSLRAKFEPAQTPVLHAVSPGRLDDGGVFTGNDLGPEDYAFLDEQLLAMAGYEGLFACVELEGGFFVLRGPGADAPTDLFLTLWRGGVLTWVADLAFAHCGEEECTRQESWLTDLDADGRRDIVRRGRIEDLATGQVEETFESWLVRPTGVLHPTSIPASERATYRMSG